MRPDDPSIRQRWNTIPRRRHHSSERRLTARQSESSSPAPRTPSSSALGHAPACAANRPPRRQMPQGEQFLSEYSGSASQIYPRVTRPNMPCENRLEEMEPPRKSAPSITSGPGRGDLLVETRPTRQPGRRGPGSLIKFTALHCGHRRAWPPPDGGTSDPPDGDDLFSDVLRLLIF